MSRTSRSSATTCWRAALEGSMEGIYRAAAERRQARRLASNLLG
jgi:hypothetical protein